MKADFSKIINDSIKITKSNKKLWVFGLVLASLGAGGSFGNIPNFGDSAKDAYKQKEEKNIDANKILGATTSTMAETLNTIPLSFYIALVATIILSTVMFTAVALYGKAWSQSGLIHGIDRQNAGESLSLYQMSDHGKQKAAEIIKINIFPGLILTGVIFLSAVIIFIPLAVFNDMGMILTTILMIPWMIFIFVSVLIMGASVHLGTLVINLESVKWREGFKRGYKIFTRYFIETFIMAVINCFAGCIGGLAMLFGLAIIAGIGTASVFGVIKFPPFLIAAGPIIFLCLLALIMFMGLISTILVVFKQSTWVLLYRQLTEEPDGQ